MLLEISSAEVYGIVRVLSALSLTTSIRLARGELEIYQTVRYSWHSDSLPRIRLKILWLRHS